jgi:hypothetical protein
VALAHPNAPAHAGGTRTFETTTDEEFGQGEAKTTMIVPPGEVVAGMRSDKVKIDAAFVWTAAPSADGKTVFVGSGDPGKVFALNVAKPAKDEARAVATLSEPWVTALAVEKDGFILAATTPGAKVYRIDPKTGANKQIAKLDVEHIWSLVHDPRSGKTYAGTGGGGTIVAIDKTGKPSKLWDSDDQHVVALADDGAGNLLAGTSEGAVLFRVRPGGQAEALHDFDADEVRAIAVKDKSIFVAVNDFDGGGDIPSTSSSKTPAVGTKLVADGKSPAAPGKLPRPGSVKAKGAVYRIEADGSIETMFSLGQGYFTSLHVDAKGNVFAAAGTEGKVFKIDTDRRASLVIDLPERQALAIVPAEPAFLVATGDLGAVYRVGPVPAGEALYESRIFDAATPARWGRLRYGATASITFETRSGNTAKPDKTWEPWRAVATPVFSGQEGEGRVVSASARYLQYRAKLPTDATLRDTAVFYVPQNQRARVNELTLADAKKGAAADARAERQHSSVLKLRWDVKNPDGDPLIYRLSYRQEDEPVWRPVDDGDPLTKPEFDWNTDTVPDGKYVVRVWVSDGAAVAQDQALSETYVSPPLLIDNTRPQVEGLLAKPPVVTGRAEDAASPIAQIEFSINGGEWRPASPSDGILDQKVEPFSFRLPELPPGIHVVAVRAYDSADNAGVAKVVVKTK